VLRFIAPFYELPNWHKKLAGLESISACPRTLKTVQLHVLYHSGQQEHFNYVRKVDGDPQAFTFVPRVEVDFFDSVFTSV
jgi:hypothetical protein